MAYHAYLPFGEEATYFLQDTERMKFTGHERDLASLSGTGDDLDYMHARHYNPMLATFLSPDPVLGDETRPQSWNRYTYTLDNPIKYQDLGGLYTVDCKVGDNKCQENAKAFEAAGQEALCSSVSAIQEAGRSYGDPGVQNGIVLRFVDAAVLGDADGRTGVYVQVDSGGAVERRARVKIKKGLRGLALPSAVVHEGQHVVDGTNYINTIMTLKEPPITRRINHYI